MATQHSTILPAFLYTPERRSAALLADDMPASIADDVSALVRPLSTTATKDTKTNGRNNMTTIRECEAFHTDLAAAWLTKCAAAGRAGTCRFWIYRLVTLEDGRRLYRREFEVPSAEEGLHWLRRLAADFPEAPWSVWMQTALYSLPYPALRLPPAVTA